MFFLILITYAQYHVPHFLHLWRVKSPCLRFLPKFKSLSRSPAHPLLTSCGLSGIYQTNQKMTWKRHSFHSVQKVHPTTHGSRSSCVLLSIQNASPSRVVNGASPRTELYMLQTDISIFLQRSWQKLESQVHMTKVCDSVVYAPVGKAWSQESPETTFLPSFFFLFSLSFLDSSLSFEKKPYQKIVLRHKHSLKHKTNIHETFY